MLDQHLDDIDWDLRSFCRVNWYICHKKNWLQSKTNLPNNWVGFGQKVIFRKNISTHILCSSCPPLCLYSCMSPIGSHTVWSRRLNLACSLYSWLRWFWAKGVRPPRHPRLLEAIQLYGVITHRRKKIVFFDVMTENKSCSATLVYTWWPQIRPPRPSEAKNWNNLVFYPVWRMITSSNSNSIYFFFIETETRKVMSKFLQMAVQIEHSFNIKEFWSHLIEYFLVHLKG